MKNQRHDYGWYLALLLALGTVLLFSGVRTHDFINYDDPVYVTENIHVQSGFTTETLSWALFQIRGEQTYWQPLTWLSHILDWKLFGNHPGPHHLVNVVLHALNAVLLFGLLRHLTGAVWRSAIVAAVFACHPLQVDTVAWIAERKNLLSTFFWIATLWTYANCVRSNVKTRRRGWYAVALISFAFGLMCKPMLVTVPLTMLLLDRFLFSRADNVGRPIPFVRLLVEKTPFFALSIAVGVVTIVAHQELGTVVSSGSPLLIRIGHACVSYCLYLVKTVWPRNLAVFYPLERTPERWQMVGAVLLILSLTIAALTVLRRYRYIAFGWGWFLVTLLPVIGLLQVGSQSMADRFMYVPLIGLSYIAVWGSAELFSLWHLPRNFIAAVAACGLIGLAVAAVAQLRYWQNSITLFEHSVAVTGPNALADYNLGAAYAQTGEVQKALPLFLRALAVKPDYQQACYNAAAAFHHLGQTNDAVRFYERALQLDSSYGEAHNNLANLLLKLNSVGPALEHASNAVRLLPRSPAANFNMAAAFVQAGHPEQAVPFYMTAVQLQPASVEAHYQLATLLLARGSLADAEAHWMAVVRLQPDLVTAHYQLGALYARQHRHRDAVSSWRRALELRPSWPEVMNNLAWLLSTSSDESVRDSAAALKLARAVAVLRGNDVDVLDTLAAAYAEAGYFDEASETMQSAIQLAAQTTRDIALLRGRLDLYQAHRAFRE